MDLLLTRRAHQKVWLSPSPRKLLLQPPARQCSSRPVIKWACHASHIPVQQPQRQSQHEPSASAGSFHEQHAAPFQQVINAPIAMDATHQMDALARSRLTHQLGLSSWDETQDFLASLILSECVYKKLEYASSDDLATVISSFVQQFPAGWVELEAVQLTREDVPHHYLVAVGGNAMYVAFMGTKQARDLVADVKALHEPVWTEAMALATDKQALPTAHSGFLQRARAIDVERLYALAQAQGRRLVLCGHSLGGAVSKLCALRLLRELPEWPQPALRCMVFATPAVGNAALAQLVESAGWHRYFTTFYLPEDQLMRVLGLLQPRQTLQAAPPSPPALLPADAPAAGTGPSIAAPHHPTLASSLLPHQDTSAPPAASFSPAGVANRQGIAGWARSRLAWLTPSAPALVLPPPASAAIAEADAVSDREAAAVESILSSNQSNIGASMHAQSPLPPSFTSPTTIPSASQGLPAPVPGTQPEAAHKQEQQADVVVQQPGNSLPTNLGLALALHRNRVMRQVQKLMPILPIPNVMRFHMFGSHIYIARDGAHAVSAQTPEGVALVAATYADSAAGAPGAQVLANDITAQISANSSREDEQGNSGSSGADVPAAVPSADTAATSSTSASGTKQSGGSTLLATAASLVQAWSPAVQLPGNPFAHHRMMAYRQRVLVLVQAACRQAQHTSHHHLHLPHPLSSLSPVFPTTGSAPAGMELPAPGMSHHQSLRTSTGPAPAQPDVPTHHQVHHQVHPHGHHHHQQQQQHRRGIQVRTDLVPSMSTTLALARLPLPGNTLSRNSATTRRSVSPGAGPPAVKPVLLSDASTEELTIMVDGSRLQYTRSVQACVVEAGGKQVPLACRVMHIHAADPAQQQAGPGPAGRQAQSPASQSAAPGVHAAGGWGKVQDMLQQVGQLVGKGMRWAAPGQVNPARPQQQAPDEPCSIAVRVIVPQDVLQNLARQTALPETLQQPADTSAAAAADTDRFLPASSASSPQLQLTFLSDFQRVQVPVQVMPWRVGLLGSCPAAVHQLHQLLGSVGAVAEQEGQGLNTKRRASVRLLEHLRARSAPMWNRRPRFAGGAGAGAQADSSPNSSTEQATRVVTRQALSSPAPVDLDVPIQATAATSRSPGRQLVPVAPMPASAAPSGGDGFGKAGAALAAAAVATAAPRLLDVMHPVELSTTAAMLVTAAAAGAAGLPLFKSAEQVGSRVTPWAIAGLIRKTGVYTWAAASAVPKLRPAPPLNDEADQSSTLDQDPWKLLLQRTPPPLKHSTDLPALGTTTTSAITANQAPQPTQPWDARALAGQAVATQRAAPTQSLNSSTETETETAVYAVERTAAHTDNRSEGGAGMTRQRVHVGPRKMKRFRQARPPPPAPLAQVTPYISTPAGRLEVNLLPGGQLPVSAAADAVSSAEDMQELPPQSAADVAARDAVSVRARSEPPPTITTTIAINPSKGIISNAAGSGSPDALPPSSLATDGRVGTRLSSALQAAQQAEHTLLAGRVRLEELSDVSGAGLVLMNGAGTGRQEQQPVPSSAVSSSPFLAQLSQQMMHWLPVKAPQLWNRPDAGAWRAAVHLPAPGHMAHALAGVAVLVLVGRQGDELRHVSKTWHALCCQAHQAGVPVVPVLLTSTGSSAAGAQAAAASALALADVCGVGLDCVRVMEAGPAGGAGHVGREGLVRGPLRAVAGLWRARWAPSGQVPVSITPQELQQQLLDQLRQQQVRLLAAREIPGGESGNHGKGLPYVPVRSRL